jgi:hypothetical protein
MAHQLDHPGGDAGVLQPGREGVANVVGAAQVDRIQQGITSNRQRRPAARRLVSVVEVDRCQVAAFSSCRATATVAGRTGRRLWR